MTDGRYIPFIADASPQQFECKDSGSVDELPDGTMDLTTLYQRLPLQPVSTEVALLYAIAADLFRRGYPGVAYEVRRQADDLKMLTRHER